MDEFLDLIVKRNVGFVQCSLMKTDTFEIAGAWPIQLERGEKFGYLFTYGDSKGFLSEETAQSIRTIIYNRLVLQTEVPHYDDEYFHFEFSIERNDKIQKFRISKGNKSRCGWYNGFVFDRYTNPSPSDGGRHYVSSSPWLGGVIQNHWAYKLMDFLDLNKTV